MLYSCGTIIFSEAKMHYTRSNPHYNFLVNFVIFHKWQYIVKFTIFKKSIVIITIIVIGIYNLL